VGGALIVPAGLLHADDEQAAPDYVAKETKEVEQKAVETVMRAERALGFEPKDVGPQKLPWDVESRDGNGGVRFIEVKGRASGARTVTVSKNQILASFNRPETFILALVEVEGDRCECRYVRRPFEREPEFAVTSINYDFTELWRRGEAPA